MGFAVAVFQLLRTQVRLKLYSLWHNEPLYRRTWYDSIVGVARPRLPSTRPLSSLFTRVRGRGILRSSLARYCIDRPPGPLGLPPSAAVPRSDRTTCCGTG